MVSGNFPSRYIVGAYATSPNLFSWDENSELVYFNLLKKLADPFDTARAIEFLISKENKYITGSGIDVSGGQFLSG